MIGVAVNGFTPLAQTKARRYGIVLYDFRTLTDKEIASWTGSATVEASFVRFSTLAIVAGVANSDVRGLPDNVSFKYHAKDGYAAVMDLIRNDVATYQGVQRHQNLATAGFNVDGMPVTQLNVGYIGHVVGVSSTCTAVQAVDVPETPVLLRDTTVQRFDHTVSQVIRKQNDVHLVIDVSGIRPPSDSILHEMKISFQAPVTITGYELAGDRAIQTKATSVILEVLATP